MTRKKAKEIYYEAIQKYKDNPNILMSEILDKYYSKYSNKDIKVLNKVISELMNASVGSLCECSYKITNFEITVNNLYYEFLSSNNIKTLLYSMKKLKIIIDYFKKNRIKENLVMPIKDFEILILELDAIDYGLSHWSDIKIFIISSSNKQVDIQKGLNLDKQKLSTFIYILDKLGFIEKETLKNRVYIKRIIDKENK